MTTIIRDELRGKNLARWCPLADEQGRSVPCHTDVLLALANPTPQSGREHEAS
jgi:hypothetical protein